jgi:hypothetical protein
MARERFNPKTKKWEVAGEEIKTPEPEVKTTIVNDEMPPTVHPCDGKVYTSAKKFRATTAAHGCVEFGDQLPSETKQKSGVPMDGDVSKALRAWEAVIGHQSEQDRARLTESEKRAQELEVLERLQRD